MKTVVITGGTRGIGLALAKKFAQNNFNIAFCSRNEDAVNAVGKELSLINSEALIIGHACDVSKEKEVLKFAEKVIGSFETIDILINNAGVFIPGEVLKEEDGMLKKMIDTNLFSAYHMSRALVDSMITQKSGYIFNIASIAGLQAYPNGGSYSISKFAMIGLGKALREELKPHGIRVTNVMPGATWTSSWEGADLPEERLMSAEDIASSVFDIYHLSKRTVVEDIVLRPQLGDL